MALIRLHGFTGLAPKIDPVYLKEYQSQSAINSRLDGGALRAWRNSKQITTLAKAGDIKTIYQMPTGEWLQFLEDVDIVKSQLADDATDRHYYTGTDTLRVTNNALVDIGGDNEYPEDSYIVGVPAPTGALTATLVPGTPTTSEDTAYVYTFVNAWGEESAPSPASNIVSVDFAAGESVNLTSFDSVPAGDYVPITKYRVYRAAVGITGADYLFVADITISGFVEPYNDAVTTDTLGEPIPTEDWDFPPTGLVGLTAMSNGMMAGFVGNKVYICEPYIPYAFPDKYSWTIPANIIGLGFFGSTLLVITDERPFAISGVVPEAMSMVRLPIRQSGVSKRSIVNMNRGVAYACPDGVQYIGEDGVRLLTDEYYTRKEWQALVPTASHAEQVDGNYVIFFSAQGQGLLLDPQTGPLFIDIDASAVWTDEAGDRMFMAVYDPVLAITNIREFNAGGSLLVYTWRSKAFIMPQLTAMTACKMNADFDAALTADELAELQAERDAAEAANLALIAAGDVCGDLNGHEINANTVPINGDCLYLLPDVPLAASYVLRIYGDDALLVEQTVNSVAPFRVPIVDRVNKYEIEISGQYPVRDVVLATSIRELKSLAT